MSVVVKIGEYAVDLTQAFDISIPVRFEEEQLSAFGAPPAKKEAYRAGSFVGDVRMGGSCNCESYTFSPHLHGTHTECVGHLTGQRIAVSDVLTESLIPATVLTVSSDNGIITVEMLNGLQSGDFLGALIVRTLPNHPRKKSHHYDDGIAPYFSAEAMQYIVARGVQHLLVDFPSVDKMDDGGALINHRIFWGVPEGGKEVESISPKTITELIYVPEAVADGHYLLNLQVAAFAADAAPSRPILYKVTT